MEFPLIQKSYTKNQKSLAIVYPNLYYGGVYCLAPLIFYNLVNKLKNWRCDRKFLDKQENINQYDLVGFTFQYELDIKNIKQIIKTHKPKITFAGGPVPNINPNVLKNIVDFQILGEIEETLPKILKLYEKNPKKEDFLKAIKNTLGVYTKQTKNITYARNENPLTEKTYPIYQPLPTKLTKEFVFQNSFLLEIERGCPFRCKFCALGSIHKTTMHYPIEEIKKIIDKGTKLNKRKKVIIYSASFTHPERKEILKHLIKNNLNASIPSTKIEVMDKETLQLIKQLKQTSLTIAPEANEKLRKTLNKNITDKQILNFLKLAKQLSFKKIKAYFLVGLPNQKEQDLKETIILIKKIKEIFPNTYISFNPFVPKPKTEFQNEKFNKKEIKQQIKFLKQNLKQIKFKIPSLSTSHLEYKIAHSGLGAFSTSATSTSSTSTV